MDYRAALDVVYRALDDLNELRSSSDRIAKSPDSRLTGVNGPLDSLALVTLAVTIERDVMDIAGREVMLFDEARVEENLLHFRSVQTLASFIAGRTNE